MVPSWINMSGSSFLMFPLNKRCNLRESFEPWVAHITCGYVHLPSKQFSLTF